MSRDVAWELIRTAFGGIIGATVAYIFWIRQSLHTLKNAYDQDLRVRRFESYRELYRICEPTAIFAPGRDLTYADFVSFGEAMRGWYFSSGGLVLTEQARDLYFTVQEMLGSLHRQVTTADQLHHGLRKKHDWLSLDHVRVTQTKLGFRHLDNHWLDAKHWPDWLAHTRALVDKLKFGANMDEDFITIQFFATSLRTVLARDIRAREQSLLWRR